MNKIEIGLIIIAILGYIILSIVLHIDMIVHIFVGIMLLAALIIFILLTAQQKIENQKISKLFRIISIIFIIGYFIALAVELFNNEPLFINSGIFIFLIFISEIISWFFRKNSE